MGESYFALQGGLKYRAVLDHFKNQARGVGHGAYVEHGSTLDRKWRGGRSLKLIDVVDRCVNNNIGNKKCKMDDKPMLESVDPAEAVRRQAVSEVEREVKRDLGDKTKSRKRSGEGGVKKRVKRVRDIFDE